MTRLMALILTSLLMWTATALGTGSLPFSTSFSNDLPAWKVLTAGDWDTSVTGGALYVRNNSRSLCIVKHDSVYRDFTYSVTMRMVSGVHTFSGIGFCLERTLGGYYFAVDSAQTFRLFKMAPGGKDTTRYLANLPNSHIQRDVNHLSVSKSGSTVRLFCNSYLLTEVQLTDPTLDSGSVGMVLAGPAAVEYDSVKVTAEFASIPRQSCFSDTFGISSLDHWYTGLSSFGAGFSIDKNGGLVADLMRAGDTVLSPIWVNGGSMGSLKGTSIQAVLSWQGGADSAAYGISFMQTVQLPGFGFTYRHYSFLINGRREFAVVGATGDDSITWTPANSATLHADGARDTLSVVWTDTALLFMANGKELIRDSRGPSFPDSISAAGLVFGGRDSVVCHSFNIYLTPDAGCPVMRPSRPVARLLYANPRDRADVGLVFDALGRLAVRTGGERLTRGSGLAPSIYYRRSGGAVVRLIVKR